jgi:hypothetical protein
MTFGLTKAQEEVLSKHYPALLSERRNGFITLGSATTDLYLKEIGKIDYEFLSYSEAEALSSLIIKMSTFRSVSK